LQEIDEDDPQTFLEQPLAPKREDALPPLLPRPLPKTVIIAEPDEGEFVSRTDDATGAV
jgi:hypothetical protein